MPEVLIDRKTQRDWKEAHRIANFHHAILEEAKHTMLDEALVQRSIRFGKRMIDGILAMDLPTEAIVVEHIRQMTALIMRLHREEMESDDG